MRSDKIIDVTSIVKQRQDTTSEIYSAVEEEKIESPETEGYEDKYSEESFWDKAKKYAKVVGCGGIEKALQLYYALDNPKLPAKTKAVIYGALGYFISPVDLIPDITPLVGFTDDMAALVATVAMVSSFIDATVKAKAHAKILDWFGEGSCEEE